MQSVLPRLVIGAPYSHQRCRSLYMYAYLSDQRSLISLRTYHHVHQVYSDLLGPLNQGNSNQYLHADIHLGIS